MSPTYSTNESQVHTPTRMMKKLMTLPQKVYWYRG